MVDAIRGELATGAAVRDPACVDRPARASVVTSRATAYGRPADRRIRRQARSPPTRSLSAPINQESCGTWPPERGAARRCLAVRWNSAVGCRSG